MAAAVHSHGLYKKTDVNGIIAAEMRFLRIVKECSCLDIFAVRIWSELKGSPLVENVE